MQMSDFTSSDLKEATLGLLLGKVANWSFFASKNGDCRSKLRSKQASIDTCGKYLCRCETRWGCLASNHLECKQEKKREITNKIYGLYANHGYEWDRMQRTQYHIMDSQNQKTTFPFGNPTLPCKKMLFTHDGPQFSMFFPFRAPQRKGHFLTSHV